MRRLAASGPRPADRPRPRDWALAAVVVVAHLAPVRAGQPDGSVDPAWVGALSILLALGSGIPLAWRRSSPLAAAGLALGCYAGLAAVQGLVPPWAAWVATWSLATTGFDRQRSIRLSAGAAATTSILLVGAEALDPGSGALVVLLAATVVVVLVAVLVRSERGRIEEAGRRATIEERLRIARDLHDLVGHGLSTVAVQSSTARLAMAAGDADRALQALASVESSSRTAMREMRQMLDVLSVTDESGSAAVRRSSGVTSRPPSPGVADIGTLVDNVRAGGLTVGLEASREWDTASPGVQLCAYRVVQEGLTNAVKHAPDSPVTIRLTSSGDSGRVSVTTAGPASAVREGARGRGLDGLRTRVTALSGEFWSGPTPQGWLLEAQLPLEGGEPR